VGNDIGNIDVSRWQIKSPFERDVVTQFDAQVQKRHQCTPAPTYLLNYTSQASVLG